jgi:iron(III) transport system substrate-binding protein
MTLNRFLLLILIPFLLLVSCSKSGKKKLVVYSPHGKEMLTEFKILYEKIHPDVEIQWLEMGSQDVLERVRSEAQNPQADIWWGAPSTIFMRAEKMNLLESYKPTWADKIPAQSKSRNNMWYGTFLTPQVIAFNNKALTGDKAPKDWDDMIKPEWKNKVIMRNPLASGTLRVIFSSFISRSIQNTGSEEQGFDYLKKLDANTNVYAADPTQMYARLGGNDPVVTLWNMPDIILQSTKYNYPFGYNFPSSGTVVLTDAIAVVKGTKNPELAKDFYEFVNTPENLIIQAEKFYRIPARNDIDKSKLPQWIAGAEYKTLDLNWELIAEKESEWMKKWDTEIKGKFNK